MSIFEVLRQNYSEQEKQYEKQELFLSLSIRRINLFCYQQFREANSLIISNNRKYIFLITSSKKVQKIKLFNLELQKLIKVIIEEQCRDCKFSQDSNNLIIQCNLYCTIYQIHEDISFKIFNDQVKLSIDSSKLICYSNGQLQILNKPFIEFVQYQYQDSDFEFSMKPNYLQSMQQNKFLYQHQYLRIKQQKLSSVSNLLFKKKGLAMRSFEYFTSGLIVIYSNVLIKLFNVQGRLVRNIKQYWIKFQNIQVMENIHKKQVLVSVFESAFLEIQTMKTIGFMQLLPQFKIQTFQMSTENQKYHDLHGPICIIYETLKSKDAELYYIV